MRKMAKSFYPLDTPSTPDTKKRAVHLSDEEVEELQLVADLWNAFDRARKIKRARIWEPKKVMEQFIRAGMEGFWDQIGGKPPTSSLRASTIRAAIAKLEEEFGTKK